MAGFYFIQKGTNFMLAQAVQVLHSNSLFSARAIQNGLLSQNFFNGLVDMGRGDDMNHLSNS